MTIFHYGLFSVHFSMLVNFKQKLVYLKYILFFPSLPTLKFPLRKSCLLKSILLSTQKDQTWSETNVMKLKLHFFFVKHCCLFQSKEARHAPLVWPGVEQLMILRHSTQALLRDDDIHRPSLKTRAPSVSDVERKQLKNWQCSHA